MREVKQQHDEIQNLNRNMLFAANMDSADWDENIEL